MVYCHFIVEHNWYIAHCVFEILSEEFGLTRFIMAEFRLGQSALDVCKVIVNHQPDISSVQLIAHDVSVNWRQLHQTTREKLKNLRSGFEHVQPIKYQEYNRDEFNRLTLDALPCIGRNEVWSIVSKVKLFSGKYKHLPMMNFHYENDYERDIKKVLKYICGNNKGVLLESGRFLHYYGDFLLDENNWIKFMAEFLMPTVLVSPRYIGHRLYDGYCTLRLTIDSKYKTNIPKVVRIF